MRKELIKIRCRSDIELFAKFFFAHHCRYPFSKFHKTIFKNYNNSIKCPLLERKGYGEAIAAPRGNAKSTLMSMIIPIHCIVYQLERYIVIISATHKQAVGRLENIRSELLTNEKLKLYFGDLLDGKKKPSKKSLIVNDIRIDALSAGMEIRGISYNEFRPSRIIIDDGEDSENVENPDLREKLECWFSEVIENLGDSYTIIEVIGTILHQDSLLANLLKRPDFKTSLYRSVITFAGSQELWDKWKAIYNDLENENRVDDARSFFLKNKPEMIKGTSVLWKEKEDYYDLMCQLISHGRRAFFKEKQNDPKDCETQIFDTSKFKKFSIVHNEICLGENGEKKIALDSLQFFGYLDPALGNKNGDFASIATVGVDSFGYIYVLDVFLGRISPTAQIEKVFDLHEIWNYDNFGIETNCFQEMMISPFEQERERRKHSGNSWSLPLNEVKNYQKKESRIYSIEPLINNGRVLFNKSIHENFYNQCEQFPTGSHDDGIDALAGAISIAKMQRISNKSVGQRKTLKSLNNF